MEELRDIKALSVITDFSWLVALCLGLVAIVGVVIAIKYLWRWQKKRKKEDKKSDIFYALDPSNAKACAYALSALRDEKCTQSNKEMYEALMIRLEKYKYKAHEGPLDPEEKTLWIEIFGKHHDDV